MSEKYKKYLINGVSLLLLLKILLDIIVIFTMDLYINKLKASSLTEPYAKNYLKLKNSTLIFI
nr:hypothetical protein [uncultured Cetobacterium sp.]